jgi:hypothetical protein
VSLHEAPALDPRYSVELGWQKDTATYWYAVYQDEQLVSCSPGEELKTLLQLVRATWGYVDWPESGDLPRRLRDEAAWVTEAKDDPASRFLARALLD